LVPTPSLSVAAGKYTVPVLWDKQSGCIVNNESSEILRMFNSECLTMPQHSAAWTACASRMLR
jgi:glutathionyl-hydroquinone reductase